MKIAVFIMAIMVMCICPGRISEEKYLVSGDQRHSKGCNCKSPKAKHGDVRTDGCIQSTCTNGKWKPKMRTDICCYKQQVHKPNTVLDTIVSADNCSSTTIGCGAVGQIEVNHTSCSIPATKQQVEKLEINLEEKIELLVEKIDNVTVNVTCGKQSDDIFKTVQEVDKKINEMNKSIEKKDDNLSGKVDEIVKITENIKNTTERQSDELSVKMNDVVQKIENDKITVENHVNDLSRKIQNQTEELANNMKQKTELVVGEIHYLNHTLENHVDDLSNQLDNQTEKIVIKMKQTEEQVKEVAGKFQTLENHMDDLSNKVSSKLENQTEEIQSQGKEVVRKIQTLENQVDDLSEQVARKLETQADQIQELTKNMENLTEMSLKMMKTLYSITELLEKDTEDTPMVEGVLITGGAGAQTSTELFLPSTGKTCSLQSLPEQRFRHTLDNLSNQIILCGGGSGSYKKSCLQFLPTSSTGSWAYYATLAQDASGHTSNVFEEDLLLIGSYESPKTTEIVGKGIQYNLQQDTIWGCAIPDESSYILTGGFRSQLYMTSVVRYNMKGFVENMPSFAHGRRGHGCGYYMDKGNNKVLVVAGGQGGRGWHSSTEVFPAGATAWQNGESLPRTLAWPIYVNMGSYFLLFGGFNDRNAYGQVVSGGSTYKHILKFNGSWTEVGMMKNERWGGAASKIEIPGPGGLLDITGCY